MYINFFTDCYVGYFKFDRIAVKDVGNHISIITRYHRIYIWSNSQCIVGKILVKIMKRYYC